MKLANVDIDRIVREVLARLETLQPAAPPSIPTASHELVLSDRLVSVDTLSGRLNDVQTLTVDSRAVITPAARDLLRERQITLVRRAATSEPSGKPAVTLAAADARLAAPLADWLRRGGWPVEQLANLGLPSMTAELAQQVARGGVRGVLLTEQPLVAVCLANRQHGVRAAMIEAPVQVDSAVRQIGCNLIVIDTARCSATLIRRCIDRLLVPNQIECPPELAWL